MKNLKLLAFIAAFSAVACAQEEETAVQVDCVAFEQEILSAGEMQEVIAPVVEEAVTVAEEVTAPAVETTTTPAVEATAAVVETITTPAVEATTPVVEVTIPVVEEATSVAEEAVTVAEEVTAPAVETTTTPAVEAATPAVEEVKVVEKLTFASMQDKAYNAYASTKATVINAAKTTADYAQVPFVKANELCNQVNQAMFTVAADDNSYVAMLKNNAAQITVGALVATAAVVATVYLFTNKTTEEEQN